MWPKIMTYCFFALKLWRPIKKKGYCLSYQVEALLFFLWMEKVTIFLELYWLIFIQSLWKYIYFDPHTIYVCTHIDVQRPNVCVFCVYNFICTLHIKLYILYIYNIYIHIISKKKYFQFYSWNNNEMLAIAWSSISETTLFISFVWSFL